MNTFSFSVLFIVTVVTCMTALSSFMAPLGNGPGGARQRPNHHHHEHDTHPAPAVLPSSSSSSATSATTTPSLLPPGEETATLHRDLSPSLDAEVRSALGGAGLKDLVGRRSSGRALCTLLLAGLRECSESASVLDCIRHVGLKRLELSIHAKCTHSGWWRAVARSVAAPVAISTNSSTADENNSSSSSPPLTFPVNYIRESQIIVAQEEEEEEGLGNEGRRKRRRKRPYIPPHLRPIAAINLSLTLPIRGGALGHARPINFGIPRELIARRVSRTKVFAMCPVTAGWLGGRKNYPQAPRQQSKGYSLDSSEEYTLAALYSHSYFGFTMFRGGTDCQRHLEILARGAVPYFPDLGLRCRSSCLAAYPVQMMREALSLPGIGHWRRGSFENQYFARGKIWINFKSHPRIDFASFDKDRYFSLADRLLNFTQNHLSCGAILSYVLRAAGVEEPRSVLIFIPQVVDYLSMCLESGAGELGLNYTTNDFSVPAAVYSRRGRKKSSPSSSSSSSPSSAQQQDDSWPPWQRRVQSRRQAEKMTLRDWEEAGNRYGASKMYGGGFTWGMRVDPPPNERQSFQSLRRRVLAKEYDLVVYSAMFLVREGRFHSSVTDNLALLDEVRTAMPPERVVFVDGDDNPLFDQHWGPALEEMVRAGSHMFVREAQHLDKGFRDDLPPRSP